MLASHLPHLLLFHFEVAHIISYIILNYHTFIIKNYYIKKSHYNIILIVRIRLDM